VRPGFFVSKEARDALTSFHLTEVQNMYIRRQLVVSRSNTSRGEWYSRTYTGRVFEYLKEFTVEHNIVASRTLKCAMAHQDKLDMERAYLHVLPDLFTKEVLYSKLPKDALPVLADSRYQDMIDAGIDNLQIPSMKSHAEYMAQQVEARPLYQLSMSYQSRGLPDTSGYVPVEPLRPYVRQAKVSLD